MHTNHNQQCCPPIDVTQWQDKTHIWEQKLFLYGHTRQFLHLPLPGSVNRTIARLWDKANSSGAIPPNGEFLLLVADKNAWLSEYYMTITDPVEGMQNVRISGTFYSRVYEGPFYRIPHFIREMDLHFAREGKLAKRYYVYAAACENCEKKNGDQFKVLFAEI